MRANMLLVIVIVYDKDILHIKHVSPKRLLCMNLTLIDIPKKGIIVKLISMSNTYHSIALQYMLIKHHSLKISLDMFVILSRSVNYHPKFFEVYTREALMS